jgi:hypothetical protein
LVVESNESLSSSAESNLLIPIVPPVVHTSSWGIKAETYKKYSIRKSDSTI